jgi:hypothetical protein
VDDLPHPFKKKKKLKPNHSNTPSPTLTQNHHCSSFFQFLSLSSLHSSSHYPALSPSLLFTLQHLHTATGPLSNDSMTHGANNTASLFESLSSNSSLFLALILLVIGPVFGLIILYESLSSNGFWVNYFV